MSEQIELLESLIRHVEQLAAAGRLGEALPLASQLLQAEDALLASAPLSLAQGLVDTAGRLIPTQRFDIVDPLLAKGLNSIHRHRASRPWELFIGLHTLAISSNMKGDLAGVERAAATIVQLASQIDEPVSAGAVSVLAQLGRVYEDWRDYRSQAVVLRLLGRTMQADPSLSTTDRASVLRGYGRALHLSGQFAEAIAAFRAARAALGDGGPGVDLAIILTSLAEAATRAGEPATAGDAWQEACRVLEASADAETALAGAAYHNYANWCLDQGRADRYDDAARLAQRAVAVSEAVHPAPTADRALSIALLARIVAAKGRRDEAARHYEASIRMFDASPDTDSRDLACYLTEWAFALLASGRAVPAVPPLRRVLELAESARTPLTANVLSNLATACFESGALDEAIPLFRRALDLRHENAPGDAGTLDRASPAAHAP